jgi:hypothetical protein
MNATTTPEIPSRRFNWTVYLALVLGAWLVNYPGRINPDTLDAITQAQNLGTLNDWQAPVVTWLLSLFTPVLGQPAGALLVQALLLFFYPAITLTAPNERRIGIADAALAVASGAFIVALIPMTGQILRDVVLVGAILCLLGVLDLSAGSGHRGARLWCTLALLFLIVAVRPTNFLMLGIAGGICAFFLFGAGRKFFLALLLIVVVCAASFHVTNYVNRKVLGASNVTQESSLIIFDIAGISSDIKQNLFAELPGWRADQVQPPWECYTPKAWDVFKWGVCKRYAELFDTAMHQAGAPPSEVQWWLSNVLRHPVSYSKHRISYTVELFKNAQIFSFGWGYPYALNIPKNIDVISGEITHGVDTGGWTHGIDMTRKFQMWEPTIAFVPFGWFAARIFARQTSLVWGLFFCVGTLLWSWRNRRLYQKFDLVVVVSSALGLGNVLMMMALGVADEGRYLAPTLVCGMVSLLRTIRAELQAREAETQRPGFSR